MIIHLRKYSLLELMFGSPGGWSSLQKFTRNDPVPDFIKEAIRRHAPHGSGIDNDITVKRLDPARGRLVLNVPFHRMDDNGMYCGWVTFTATFQAHLDGDVSLTVRGACRDASLKEGLSELLYYHFTDERFIYAVDSVETPVFDRFFDYRQMSRGHFRSDFEREVYEEFEKHTTPPADAGKE